MSGLGAMRGTILRLKSHSFNFSTETDNSGDESQSFRYEGEQQKFSPHLKTPMEVTSSTPDANKNVLMSNLELQSTSSASAVATETRFSSHDGSIFHRPVFDWNDDLMWKAMSRHPLFSKYMELQSQLHTLFEEIRLDCKKAACEKALASLVKEATFSPIQVTSIAMHPKSPAEAPPKKKGRPMKKKPGRPRKETTTTLAEWSNDSPGTPNKNLRKCRDELFLARKPSWICQNCAKRFSSSGWLDRHRSVCSFSKLSKTESVLVDENQDISSIPALSMNLSNDPLKSAIVNERFTSSPRSTEAVDAVSSCWVSLTSPSKELTENSISNLTQSSSFSPLQPKRENHKNTDDDEGPKKPLFDEETRCTDVGSSNFKCGNCKQQFAVHSLLMRHWEEFSDCKLFASHHGSDGESGEYSSDSSTSACEHCGKSFLKHKVLKRHESMCHFKAKTKILQCIHCLKAFSSPKRHEQHHNKCSDLKIVRGRVSQRCENCSLIFPTQKRLLKHQAICCPDSNNHMIKLLKCLKCSMVFPTYKKQLKHRAVCCPDRETNEMVCHLCSKVLIMPDRMAAHKKKCGKPPLKFQ